MRADESLIFTDRLTALAPRPVRFSRDTGLANKPGYRADHVIAAGKRNADIDAIKILHAGFGNCRRPAPFEPGELDLAVRCADFGFSIGESKLGYLVLRDP